MVLEKKGRPKKSLKDCFLLGSNSTCRGHIAIYHSEEYKKWCEAATPPIKLNFRCIPQEAGAKDKSEKQQSVLTFSKVKATATEFTREALLDAVAKLIVCDDQVRLEVRLDPT
jgi:hypothetical protein